MSRPAAGESLGAEMAGQETWKRLSKEAGSAIVPSAVTLLGNHVSLAPLGPEDADDIFRLTHAGERDAIWAEMKVGPFDSVESFWAHVGELLNDRSRTFLTLRTSAAGRVGWLCLMEARPAHRVIELGYVLFAPALQQTIAASESFFLIMRHIFDDLGYRRLEWTCTTGNAKSRRAADRLGFVFEGILRDGLILKGRAVDICMYSMLAREWALAGAAFEAWLSHDNFVDGRQIRSLKEIRTANAE
ncbi:GNAT family N-acetyltransferase [Mesorhizobium mediterraneum]|uniref:GNAT family N-acetyltransferase n=1 Tax=Mesorhizobium mediterraneum TaxID=43617 RepID=UPI0017877196|nr:GNAT family protein [Mesorhizobium mediterraneum]